MSDVVMGDRLFLNRELEGIAGMTITAMSQPGGLAVLLRGVPEDPVDCFIVSVCHRPPGGGDQITNPAVLWPPGRDDSYDHAIFGGVEAQNVISIWAEPVKKVGSIVGFVVRGERLPEAVIGLG